MYIYIYIYIYIYSIMIIIINMLNLFTFETIICYIKSHVMILIYMKMYMLYIWKCTCYDHYIYEKPDIGLVVRVFADGLGDLGSIPGRVIPKTQKMVFDASLLNTQHYKVWIKGKVEQSRERSSAFPYTLV